MKSPSNVQMHAVAFLYDHLSDFPTWIRKLTPAQLESIAKLMLAWHATMAESTEILPLEETEKREMTRAITPLPRQPSQSCESPSGWQNHALSKIEAVGLFGS